MLGIVSFITKGLIAFIVIALFAIIAIKWSDAGLFDGVRKQETELVAQTKKEMENKVVRIIAIIAMVLLVLFVLFSIISFVI